jgi:hypothetical protein
MSTRETMPPSDEARVHHMANLEGAAGPTSPWAGWVTFAAMLLILLGTLHGFQGFLALFDEGYFVAGGSELVLVNYNAWGFVMILWGIVLMSVGAGLNVRAGWARWTATVVVMLDVILQVGFLPSSPLLSTTLIAFDVIVLFALTARWDEARQGGVL